VATKVIEKYIASVIDAKLSSTSMHILQSDLDFKQRVHKLLVLTWLAFQFAIFTVMGLLLILFQGSGNGYFNMLHLILLTYPAVTNSLQVWMLRSKFSLKITEQHCFQSEVEGALHSSMPSVL
jgi:uncharacterized membrane protein YqjE